MTKGGELGMTKGGLARDDKRGASSDDKRDERDDNGAAKSGKAFQKGSYLWSSTNAAIPLGAGAAKW